MWKNCYYVPISKEGMSLKKDLHHIHEFVYNFIENYIHTILG